MKRIVKFLALVLVLLLLVSTLASCSAQPMLFAILSKLIQYQPAPPTFDGEAEPGPLPGTEQETEIETMPGTEHETELETFPETGGTGIEDPDTPDFSDAPDNTVTFFHRSDTELWQKEICVDAAVGDALYDAVYYRNQAVEKDLGVSIKAISQPGNWQNHKNWNQTLRNAVMTKSCDFDAAAIGMNSGVGLSLEGMYHNLYQFPGLYLENPWWNQSLIAETTLFDNLFFLAGDIALSETASTYALFYNQEMFDQLYRTQDIDLYGTVMAGEWTMDQFYDLVSGAWVDRNRDGTVSEGDTIGLGCRTIDTATDAGMDAWAVAMGVKFTVIKEELPVLSVFNENSVNAFEAVQNLHVNNPGVLVGQAAIEQFGTGNALFARDRLHAASSFSDDVSFGVLPLPKYDKDQADYRTVCESAASLITVLSTVPQEKSELVGVTLEQMAAKSAATLTDAFFRSTLAQGRDNILELELYHLVVDSRVYDLGYCYSTVELSDVAALFRNMSADFIQAYESKRAHYESAMETLIDRLDEMAFVNAQNKNR